MAPKTTHGRKASRNSLFDKFANVLGGALDNARGAKRSKSPVKNFEERKALVSHSPVRHSHPHTSEDAKVALVTPQGSQLEDLKPRPSAPFRIRNRNDHRSMLPPPRLQNALIDDIHTRPQSIAIPKPALPKGPSPEPKLPNGPYPNSWHEIGKPKTSSPKDLTPTAAPNKPLPETPKEVLPPTHKHTSSVHKFMLTRAPKFDVSSPPKQPATLRRPKPRAFTFTHLQQKQMARKSRSTHSEPTLVNNSGDIGAFLHDGTGTSGIDGSSSHPPTFAASSPPAFPPPTAETEPSSASRSCSPPPPIKMPAPRSPGRPKTMYNTMSVARGSKLSKMLSMSNGSAAHKKSEHKSRIQTAPSPTAAAADTSDNVLKVKTTCHMRMQSADLDVGTCGPKGCSFSAEERPILSGRKTSFPTLNQDTYRSEPDEPTTKEVFRSVDSTSNDHMMSLELGKNREQQTEINSTCAVIKRQLEELPSIPLLVALSTDRSLKQVMSTNVGQERRGFTPRAATPHDTRRGELLLTARQMCEGHWPGNHLIRYFLLVQEYMLEDRTRGQTRCIIESQICRNFGEFYSHFDASDNRNPLIESLRGQGYYVEWLPCNMTPGAYRLYLDWSRYKLNVYRNV